jgi:hypothetical protein
MLTTRLQKAAGHRTATYYCLQKWFSISVPRGFQESNDYIKQNIPTKNQ